MNSIGKDREKENLFILGGNVYWYDHYGKQNGISLKKLKLLYESAVSLLGMEKISALPCLLSH